MIIGQTIFKSATSYYSPWFPRQGDAATFAAQSVAISATGTLKVVIETKNLEDVDTAAVALGTITLSTTTPGTVRVSGLKELVRFRYDMTGSASTDWSHFRVLPPAWEAN